MSDASFQLSFIKVTRWGKKKIVSLADSMFDKKRIFLRLKGGVKKKVEIENRFSSQQEMLRLVATLLGFYRILIN